MHESLSGSFVLTDGERRSEREKQTEREGGRGRREACWVNSPQLILFLFCQRVLRLSKPLSLDLTPAPRHGNEPPHTQADTHTHAHTEDDRDGTMKRKEERGRGAVEETRVKKRIRRCGKPPQVSVSVQCQKGGNVGERQRSSNVENE